MTSKLQTKKELVCQDCGLPIGVPKIMDGTAVKRMDKYPWIVSFINLETSMLYCGGVLISSTFVLTAAHCVEDQDKLYLDVCMKSAMAKECFRSPDSFKIGVLVRPDKEIVLRKKVKRVIPHPEYSSELEIHDIALVELQSGITCKKLAKPICLPRKSMSRIGQTLVISGWGKYDRKDLSIHGRQKLMEGTVNEVKDEECLAPASDQRHIICAAGVNSTQASCLGDSGTAIFKKDDESPQFYALGVTSVGPTNCSSTDADSYSDIFYYMDWIKSHVKDLPSPQSEKEDEEKVKED